MRRVTAGSSLRNCLAATSASSIDHAKLALQILERDQALAAVGDTLQDLLGNVEVLEVLDMILNGLLDVERFAATRRASEAFQAGGEVVIEADRERMCHGHFLE